MVNRMRRDMKFDRRKKVLEMIVRYHIATAEPVGSQMIARDMALSSATIRNIMFDLEEEGLTVKLEPYSHAVGHCARCRTVVEPIASKQ